MSTPDFFCARRDAMIDPHRPLAVLSARLPWGVIEGARTDGSTGLPCRGMTGQRRFGTVDQHQHHPRCRSRAILPNVKRNRVEVGSSHPASFVHRNRTFLLPLGLQLRVIDELALVRLGDARLNGCDPSSWRAAPPLQRAQIHWHQIVRMRNDLNDSHSITICFYYLF